MITHINFCLEAYKNAPENYGPQTLYFLSCLAGGAGMPEKALRWLKYAIINKAGGIVQRYWKMMIWNYWKIIRSLFH